MEISLSVPIEQPPSPTAELVTLKCMHQVLCVGPNLTLAMNDFWKLLQLPYSHFNLSSFY